MIDRKWVISLEIVFILKKGWTRAMSVAPDEFVLPVFQRRR